MAASQQVQWVDVQDILRGQHTEHVLVAKYIVNIGAVQGGVVNVAAPKNQAADRIRPHRAAPHVLPRPVPGFLDRSHEQNLVGQALARRQVVDIHGPDGAGKTALASRAMQAQLPSAFPDGMLYLSARHETRKDLLQDIFQGFFQSDDPVKVTENDVRQHMAGKQALIVVDDANLLQEGEAEDLAQVIPQCALLVAAQEQQIWMGTGIALRGLPNEYAVRLFEQHWGPVRANDSATVAAICEALDNVPLSIVKIATTAKRQHLSLDQVLRRVQPRTKERDATPPALALVASQLSEGQRTVLAGLAAAGGPTVGVEALPVITGLQIEEIRQHLIPLQERELISTNSTRCSLDDGLRSYIEQAWTSAEMKARAAGYYLMKAPALQTLPKDPDEENVLSALDYYVEQEQWQQVTAMVRSVDRYLATTGRWEQWRRRLEQALQATRRLGDRATEAWVQNQLGVIAMGLGETTVALQLFRSALSIRRALSDRAGALVTRWNLRVLTPLPPTPLDRVVQRITSLLKSGSLWVPIALTAIATLGLVALLASMTVTAETGLDPTPPPSAPAATFTPSPTPLQSAITQAPAAEIPPSAEVSLAAGCGETLAPGTDRTIQIRANTAGRVAVYLLDPKSDLSALFEVDVRPGETISQTWMVPDQAGIWTLEANLNHGQAHARCMFEVATPVEPPVQITRVPPSPISAVNLWLAEGCGRTLRPGTKTLVSFQASVAGQVTIYLASKQHSTQFLFSQRVQAGRVFSRSWTVTELPGNWSLVAVLNNGQARGYCGFVVTPTPTPPAVQIRLEEGCGYAFPVGETYATSTLYLRANVDGWVNAHQVSPKGEPVLSFREWLTAGAEIQRQWDVPDLVGNWAWEAVLNDGQARDRCLFQIQETPPITPTDVTPTVDIVLQDGCDQVYDQDAGTTVQLRSNVDGSVAVFLEGPKQPSRLQFTQRVRANQVSYTDWIVAGGATDWALRAILNDGQAQDLCRFRVEPTPVPEEPEVWITTDRGCTKAVYLPSSMAQISFGTSVDGTLTVWLSGQKQPIFSGEVAGGSTYQDVIKVGEEPGMRSLLASLQEWDISATCSFLVQEVATTPVLKPTLGPTLVITPTAEIATPVTTPTPDSTSEPRSTPVPPSTTPTPASTPEPAATATPEPSPPLMTPTALPSAPASTPGATSAPSTTPAPG